MYYLVSTAGIPNLGDELIAATWLRYLAEQAPDTEVILDCVNPAAVAAPLRNLHPRLRVVSVLWRLCFDHWSLGPDVAPVAERLAADPSRADGMGQELELLAQARVIHLTGGGFLNGIWPAFAALPAAILAAATRSGAVTAVTGVGLTPAAPGVGERLSRFTVTDVRDQPSAELLGDLGLCSCDDVFLNPQAFLAAGDAPEVMVSLQTTRPPATMFPPLRAGAGSAASDPANQAREARAAHGMTMLLDFTAKTLSEWDATEVGLIECWPETDRPVRDRVRELASNVRFYSLEETLRDGFPASPGQAWLSTRFHPHLLAAAAGAGGVAVNLMKGYYDTKHGSLVAQGSGWKLAHHRPFDRRQEIPARPERGGFTPETLATLRNRKRAIAERIYG